jgi:hypothetical protein
LRKIHFIKVKGINFPRKRSMRLAQDRFKWHISMNMALQEISGFRHGVVGMLPLLGEAIESSSWTA